MASRSTFTRRPRSGVWAYFEHGNEKHSCKLCSKTYSKQSGTSNLLAHLKSAHPAKYAELHPAASASESPADSASGVQEKPLAKSNLSSWIVSTATPQTRPCSSGRSEQLTELLLDWIVDSVRPLSVVSDDGFIRVMKFTEPSYTVPSRTHVTSLLKKRHQKGVTELTAMLEQQGNCGVALTTDGWTSVATHSYVTYTGHFIDSTWTLCSVVLQTDQFHGTHTAVRLAEHLKSVLVKFNVDTDLVSCVTHDEAANMVAMSRLLHEEDGIQGHVCMAHRLQTAIRHGISKTNGVERLLAAGRKLVGHFKQSAVSSENLREKQLQLNPNKPPLVVLQDVSTRWNSTFFMLSRLVELRTALTVVLSDSAITPKKEHRDLLLKDQQWTIAAQLVDILRPFELATTIASGQQYVTLSLELPVINKLIAGVDHSSTAAGSGVARSFSGNLRDSLNSKFSMSSLNTSSPAVMASALDPRFRDLSFLDDDERDEVHEHVFRAAVEAREGRQAQASAPEPPAKKAPVMSSLAMLMSRPVEESSEELCDEDEDNCARIQKQTSMYFTEDPVSFESNPLQWWKMNATRFPDLLTLARRFLAVAGSSVPSEVVFSAAGVLLTKRRNALNPSNVDAQIFLRKNHLLKSARSQPSTIEKGKIDRILVLPEEEEAAEPPLPDL